MEGLGNERVNSNFKIKLVLSKGILILPTIPLKKP
jgi:hypothetical protein